MNSVLGLFYRVIPILLWITLSQSGRIPEKHSVIGPRDIDDLRRVRFMLPEQFSSILCRVPGRSDAGNCIRTDRLLADCLGDMAEMQQSADCEKDHWCCFREEFETRGLVPVSEATKSVENQAASSLDEAPCGRVASQSNSTGDTKIESEQLSLYTRYARVFDGEPIERDRACWTAAIYYKGTGTPSDYEFLCSGIIIKSDTILTAAHCVQHFLQMSDSLAVHVGITDADIREPLGVDVSMQRSDVSEIVISPHYREKDLFMDIAVLKLHKPFISTSTVCRVCLAQKLEDHPCMASDVADYKVTGFGAITDGGYFPQRLNQAAVSRPRKQFECEWEVSKYLRTNVTLPHHMICTKNLEPGKGLLCDGDGGAALTCNIGGQHTLLGVGSWSPDCSKSAGFFTSMVLCKDFPSNPATTCPLPPWMESTRESGNKIRFSAGGPRTCGNTNTNSIDPFLLESQTTKEMQTEAESLKAIIKEKAEKAGVKPQATMMEMQSLNRIVPDLAEDKELPVTTNMMAPYNITHAMAYGASNNQKKPSGIFTAENGSAFNRLLPSPERDLIVGGTRAVPEELCWQVFITSGCGGSIISDRHILTAAHCVMIDETTSRDPRGLLVITLMDKYPADLPLEKGQMLNVKQIHAHPGYFRGNKTHNFFTNDIAIVELDSQIELSDAGACKICLKDRDPQPGEYCAAMGYGCQQPTEAKQPCADGENRNLMKLRVTMPDNKSCGKFFKGNYPEDLVLCSASRSGQGPCFGDSGGPLVCMDRAKNNYYQSGIASFTINMKGDVCANTDLNLQYYTKTGSYIKWIQSIVGSSVV